jgi:protein TonB
MDTNKILSADILDLIFDDRNKAYGAYELRKTYSKRVTKALVITFSVAGLILAGTLLANTMKPSQDEKLAIKEVTLENLDQDEPEPLPEPERQPEPEPEVRTEQFTEFNIVPEDQVDDPPPTQDDLANAKIDVATNDGIDDNGIVAPVELPGVGIGVVDVRKPENHDEPFTKVEVEARFDGNWEKFLTKNLRPEVPVDNNAPVGRHRVVVQFVVDVDGTVSNIKPMTNVGYGMEEEAVRVLRMKAAKWVPAFQNSKHVKAYRSQVIIFEVQGDE